MPIGVFCDEECGGEQESKHEETLRGRHLQATKTSSLVAGATAHRVIARFGMKSGELMFPLRCTPTSTVGVEEETNCHAVMSCTKAKGLRQRMRQAWNLHDQSRLRYTGDDWALILLDSVDAITKQHLLFLWWWRAWHLRNDSIFGNGKETIEDSASQI
ncbi:hypothetical protein BRADI_1g33012v3 [Brachypodium distachyon]|uniref:Uncharacterized protein n=1 Tax=Brachypodium distachyon TaxID=15368 RepID=A0A2K2DMF6_BRADI|nr:hypothetical protein BRADI_1g33012v3 [Brachypodium distachyon]